MCLILGLTVSPLQVWNLETNKTYLFRVKAENRYGKSDPCTTEEVLITDPFGLPGPPEKPTVAEYSKTSMTLTWEPPRETGGSKIIGYWLEKREKGTDYWAKVNKMPVTKRGMKGWEYQVSCWCKNKVLHWCVQFLGSSSFIPTKYLRIKTACLEHFSKENLGST